MDCNRGRVAMPSTVDVDTSGGNQKDGNGGFQSANGLYAWI